MIVIATEDTVVLRKEALLFAREPLAGLLRKIRSMFSRVPIRNVEE